MGKVFSIPLVSLRAYHKATREENFTTAREWLTGFDVVLGSSAGSPYFFFLLYLIAEAFD